MSTPPLPPTQSSAPDRNSSSNLLPNSNSPLPCALPTKPASPSSLAAAVQNLLGAIRPHAPTSSFPPRGSTKSSNTPGPTSPLQSKRAAPSKLFNKRSLSTASVSPSIRSGLKKPPSAASSPRTTAARFVCASAHFAISSLASPSLFPMARSPRAAAKSSRTSPATISPNLAPALSARSESSLAPSSASTPFRGIHVPIPFPP